MDFYTGAARVVLVVVGVLTLIPIIGGLIIVGFSLNDRFNVDRFLAIVGALGGPMGLWAFIVLLWKWRHHDNRSNNR